MRYEALSELASKHSPTELAVDTKLLYWLSDEHVKQDITAQHIIIRPRQREMRVFVPRELLVGE